MKDLIAKARLFINHEEHRATILVGTFIASVGEIHAQWPDAVSSLPQWPWLVSLENHAYAVLGLLVVYTRLRRFLKEAP